MPSRPSSSSSQNSSGEPTPPANLQPIPITATGSTPAAPGWAEGSPRVIQGCPGSGGGTRRGDHVPQHALELAGQVLHRGPAELIVVEADAAEDLTRRVYL